MKSSPNQQNQKEIINQYAKQYPEYKKLARELKNLIKSVLNKEDIEFVDIVGRAKKVKSFKNKMLRKKYKNPLTEMEDLCALRIICNFPEDLRKIEDILKKNFVILAYHNQERNISPYKFWYRSHHFQLRLDDRHINKSNYKSLKHFVAEVQVRTLFMDAWANIEHQINYKHEWNTSDETKRKLSRLSALLELADEQLEELLKNK